MSKPADVLNELNDEQLDDVMKVGCLLSDPPTRRIMAYMASDEK